MSSKKHKSKRLTKISRRPLYRIFVVLLIPFIVLIGFSVVDRTLHPNCNRTCQAISDEVNKLKLNPDDYQLRLKSTTNSSAVFGEYTNVMIEYEVLSHKTAKQVYSDVINAFVNSGCKRELMANYPHSYTERPSVMEGIEYNLNPSGNSVVDACYNVSIKYFVSHDNSQNSPSTNAADGSYPPAQDISDMQVLRFTLSATYI